MFEPQNIPGMIEPVEQQLLTELARKAESGRVIEFGAFFGRSTACLVNGAAQWWAGDPQAPAVEAFDSFQCQAGGQFAALVRNFARHGGVEALVAADADRVDFLPVYRHFLAAAETRGILRTHRRELRDSTHDGAPISLMHIDAPKFYEELRFLLFRFFPALQPGATVVFQDFLYHWSATLVSAVQALVEAGILGFERSAATAMVTTVLRTPTPAELAELDLQLSGANVTDLLDRTVAACSGLPIDRPEQFVPRLMLAKVQYLWTRGDTAAARDAFGEMIRRQGGRFTAPVFSDFMELLGHGFDFRSAYELDH